MNQGVEMILKRIESNPDEFWIDINSQTLQAPSKWEWVIREVFDRVADLNPKNETSIRNARYPALPYLTNDEVSVLYDALMKAQGNSFTAAVMNTLLSEAREVNYGASGAIPSLNPKEPFYR